VFLDGATACYTRSLCAQSPAQSEQWCCWFGHRRSIFGSAEIAAIRALQRSTNPRASIAAEILALGPQLRFPRAAAQTRIVSVATIRPDPGNLCDLSKQIIFGDISEFEAHMPSHAVRSPWPCPVCRNTRQKGDVGSRGAGSSGPARHARRWMGGKFASPSRISSAIISVEKPCKKTTPLAASRNNPSLMTSACRASNLHRAILLPSDNLVNVVWCTQGH
jgi:hypothetical protein